MKVPGTSAFQVKLIVCEVMSNVLIGVNVLLSKVYAIVTFVPVTKGESDTLTVMF